jgi:hypothetical protein
MFIGNIIKIFIIDQIIIESKSDSTFIQINGLISIT